MIVKALIAKNNFFNIAPLLSECHLVVCDKFQMGRRQGCKSNAHHTFPVLIRFSPTNKKEASAMLTPSISVCLLERLLSGVEPPLDAGSAAIGARTAAWDTWHFRQVLTQL
jgi:hypothetical protein